MSADWLASSARSFVVQTEDVGDWASGVLPVGTVTFLLTDVEGSTRLWEANQNETAAAVARHYEILDAAVGAAGGVRPVEQGEGDSIVAAFATAKDALRAALDAQRQLHEKLDGLPVRMAIHTGEAQLRDEGNYVGRTIIRCARLRACGHGGQVLVSESTAALVFDDLPEGAALVDLGLARLRDLSRPERVWQLAHPELRRDFPALRSLEATPNNLPTPTTSFIGRSVELEAVASLMHDQRLVTLTGSGGCGKTRLAVHVAGELVDHHPGGVWWAELAPVAVGSQVPDRIAASIGLPSPSSGDLVRDVVAHLRGQGAVLVVVDNAEHVIDDAARVVEAVLLGCPETHVLVTSREPLGLPGETVFRVPSLAVPTSIERLTLERLQTFDAARLFLDRARQARGNLVVDDRTVPAIAAICARLDGIPLALELAAARARSVPLDRLARGLDDAFRLLTGGARTALARQQTLLASIAWSYDLLDETERALLRRLAVFQGPFPLDAAEAVAADGSLVDEFEVLDLIGRLVDKSLVQLDDETGHYRLLETLRQFGLDRLRDAHELLQTRARHCEWFARWCEAADRGVHGFSFDSSHPVVHDVLAALDWAYDNSPMHVYRITRGLGWIRQHFGHFAEMSRQYDWIANRADVDPSSEWATAVAGLVWSSFYLGRSDHAELVERAAALLPPGDRATARMLATFDASREALDVGDVGGLQRGIHDAMDDGDQFGAVLQARILSPHLMVVGRFAEITSVVDFVRAALAEHGEDLTSENSSMIYAAWMSALVEQGELDEARRLALAIRPERQSVTAVVSGSVIARLAQVMDDRELLRQAIALNRSELPPLLLGPGLVIRCHTLLVDGRPEEAVATARAAYSQSPGAPGTRSAPFQLLVLSLLATGHRDEVDPYVAEFQASIEHLENVPLAVADFHQAQALVARADGQTSQVAVHAHDLVASAHRHDFVLLTIDGLELLAEVAAGRTDTVTAARLFGAASAHRDRIGYKARMVPDPATVDALVADLPDREPAGFAEGAALTLSEAVEYAQRTRGARGRPSHGWPSLTPTETKVVELVAEGCTNEDVARRLLMSPATVKTHLTHVYAKTATSNRTELTARWKDL